MQLNRLLILNFDESFLNQSSFQISVNGSLLLVAEAVSGVLQISVLRVFFFVIYVNDVADNLTLAHLLYDNSRAWSLVPCGPRALFQI